MHARVHPRAFYNNVPELIKEVLLQEPQEQQATNLHMPKF